jgi:hypothetical protein
MMPTGGIMETVTWTQKEVDERLAAVRAALLHFLGERHRLEWFEHKVRWRLSRRYIWPAGSPEERETLLNEAVEDDVSVEAFRDYLVTQQKTIANAIERYNHAVRRHMEQELSKPLGEFSDKERTQLRRRRITFQGTRDELCRVARDVRADSSPTLIPELLSLRLAILTHDVRDQIFGEAAAFVAYDAADANDLAEEERDLIAVRTVLWLRCLDQYHVAKLMADTYTEARRLMDFDELIERLQQRVREERDSPGADATRVERIEIIRDVLRRYIEFLEESFPSSAGTHTREATILREAP